MPQSPLIFLSAAEASGDDHAARLIKAIRDVCPDARFTGAAGPQMQAAGCEKILDLTERASMILGPFANLAYYRRSVKTLQAAIAERKPDVVVPVDSPALNWHIAKAAKSANVPVMYYIAPQVWAWAPWRIRKIRRFIDKLACILPFEEEYFRSRGVNAAYIGHPLFDELPPHDPAESYPDIPTAWADGAYHIALIPGSRSGEILSHATAMAKTAHIIQQTYPQAQCTFTAVNEKAADEIRRQIGEEFPIRTGQTADVLAESHYAIAASGTVTLKVAHFGTPMTIVYRVGFLRWHGVGRWLIRTKYLSLVNILAGREIVPELMPWFGRPEVIAQAALKDLDDVGHLMTTRKKLLNLTAPLRVVSPENPLGASANAARLVLSLLD